LSPDGGIPVDQLRNARLSEFIPVDIAQNVAERQVFAQRFHAWRREQRWPILPIHALFLAHRGNIGGKPIKIGQLCRNVGRNTAQMD